MGGVVVFPVLLFLSCVCVCVAVLRIVDTRRCYVR